MSLDLGELTALATAIGLIGDDGQPNASWFKHPGDHLSCVLSNPVQREALVSLVDQLLGGGDATTDEAGVSWLPVVEAGGGAFRLFVTLKEVGGGSTVRIGAGVRVRTGAAGAVQGEVDAHVPLFLASGTDDVSDPLLLGKAGAPVDVTLRLRLPPGTTPGRVGLAAAELGASIPTFQGESAAVRLALLGLRMPGATAARDLVIAADDADGLDDALLELVLGLVQAQVDALLPGSPLSGLASMLGLADDDVPDFPVADVAARGAVALADWLAAALTGPGRSDWMDGLATVLGGSVAATTPDTVDLIVAGTPVRLQLQVVPGASGRLVVTPRVSTSFAASTGVRLELAADMAALDLGSGTAVALPRLALTARIGTPGSGTPLLSPVAGPGGLQLQVGALEVGLALDAGRRPVLVVAARDADVGATHYDLLDLSTPEALAAATGQAVADAATALLGGIGPAGGAVAVLLGLADVPGATGVPRVDAAELLRDPVATVRAHWLALATTHAAAVPAVLAVLRDAVADAQVRTDAVAGSGSATDPWRVPLAPGVALVLVADGGALDAALDAGAAGDLADSGVRASLALRLHVARLDLQTGTVGFVPGAQARLALTGVDGARLVLSRPGAGASLASLGMVLEWVPAAGVRLRPEMDDVRLHLPSGVVTLPPLALDAAGRLALDAAGWRVVERLAGAGAVDAGGRAGLPWLPAAAALAGWIPPGPFPGTPVALSLADLAADPRAALEAWLHALVRDDEALRAVLEVFASALADTPAEGRGAVWHPWVVPLVAAAGGLAGRTPATLPALVVSLGAQGVARPAALAPPWLLAWQAGDAGFGPAALVAALAAAAEHDEGLAALLAERGDLTEGWLHLVDRWTSTDGLVTLPGQGLPTGVTGHRPADLVHGEPLDGESIAGILDGIWAAHFGGAAPGAVVLVAVEGAGRHGAPQVLPPGAAAATARVLDLTAPGLPPEAFPLPVGSAAGAPWVVRLGSRAACRLPDGHPAGPDADGVAGQAARLRRVLAPLAAPGADIAVVAHGSAGHAAVRAVDGLAGVRTVVTVGTPWSPVSVDTIDAVPAGEALRLLAALLRDVDGAGPAAPRSRELALARGLAAALLDLDPFADPLADLHLPGGLAAPAGVPVHAVVGSFSPPTLRRVLTAVTAAALAARVAAPDAPALSSARLGLRLPLLAGGGPGGLLVRVAADVELAEAARSPAGTVAPPPAGAAVRVRLELGAASGWLVGGPDPGRGGSGARLLACRRLTAEVALPLRSWSAPAGTVVAAARARLVLHEVAAFGIVRDRWVVEAGPGAGATPLLPEVRAVLAEVAARVEQAAAADPSLAAVRNGLAALGVLGPAGGVDAITLEGMLLDPEETVAAVRADPVRRAGLAAALRALAGDARPAATAGDTVELRYGDSGEVSARLDLAGPALVFHAAGDAGVPWAAELQGQPGSLDAWFRIGPDLPAPGGALDVAGAPTVAVVVTAAAVGVDAELRVRGAEGAVRAVSLWPAPSAGAVLDLLTQGVLGLLLQALLDPLRAGLAGRSPAAAAALDALLHAGGLLGPPGDAGERSLRPPQALLADPAAWLRALPAGAAGAVPALLDALRGMLDAGPGAPGTLPLADGVRLHAAVLDGRLVTSVEVDAAAFAPPAAGLAVAGRVGLTLDAGTPGAAPLPDVDLSVAASGAGALRLRVAPTAGGAGDAVGVTLSLAPQGRPEVVLVPGGPGLAGLADAAAAGAVAALPVLLDALAAADPAAPAPATTPLQIAGRVAARLGDALALRTGSPARFAPGQLAAFGADPGAALASRGASLASGGLGLLVDALAPLLGPSPGVAVTVAGSDLLVTVGSLALRWLPGSAGVTVTLALAALPGVERIDASVTLTQAAGLAELDVKVGPALLDGGVFTLNPYGRIRAGAGPTRAVEVGLETPAGSLAYRWDLATGTAGLAVIPVGAAAPTSVPAAVAPVVVGAVLDLAGSVVLGLSDVQDALTARVLGSSVEDLLQDVLLLPGVPDRLDPALVGDLADSDRLLRRLAVLGANLAAAPDAALPIGGKLTLRMTGGTAATPVLGLSLDIDGSWELNPGGDLVVSLETEDGWIVPAPGARGLTVELMELPPAPAPPLLRPSLTVAGLGVRLSRADGPLLDAGLAVNTVAAHFFGRIQPGGGAVAGGVRLELAGLAVGLAGARGGSNSVAQGVMGQAGPGDAAPAPRFSPAVAVQKHPAQPVRVSVSAGPGSGPWWLTVQRQFGPVYLEQVGLAVVNPPGGIESVGILIDGGVSLMGLSASVDDLSLTYVVDGTGSALDPQHWRVDLAGFAVGADISGITLAGGLRRFTPAEGGVEYLGMLMARMSVYGVSVYGGYGLVGPADDRYTSMFLFGAVNGPIGGLPAFFVTGIGGGFGINRRLSLPPSLAQFATFPLIKALDPAARAGDPFQELADARVHFAPERGTFWFAAGVSFTSFALVNGVAVIAVQVGNGFELSLLGLARMALPRPEAALVNIEMALVARFSTREGVILVQAQLTDNSWLLDPSVRLTGGFAFATWFSGPNRGQFVVTMGGYHPDFHRDGYPRVPRLGLLWRVGDYATITGESYFALTSEALMAGTRMEISAQLGPGWAHVVFGGDAIVFFDPFWMKVTVYASIHAGVTVDLWLGEVSYSVHLSARIEVTAPPFHAIAEFEVGPVGLTLEIGQRAAAPVYLPWDAFVGKYLEEARPGLARALAAVPGAGAAPPAGAAASGGAASPDGTPGRPFRVVPEFEITLTSMVPLRALVAGGPRRDLAASAVVSVAPMGERTGADILLTVRLTGPAGPASAERVGRLQAVPQQLGAFPLGTWGAAPDLTAPTVPAGEMLSATDRVLLRAAAEIPGTREGDALPPAIPYRQVDTGARRLLPFVTEDATRRAAVLAAVHGLSGLVPAAADGPARLAAAGTLLAVRGGRGAADVAAWRADRAAAPLLGSLGEGLGRVAPAAEVVLVAPVAQPPPPPLRAPRVRALLVAPEVREPFTAELQAQRAPGVFAADAASAVGEARVVPRSAQEGRAAAPRTTVSAGLLRAVTHVAAAPPTLAGVEARLSAAVPARLLRLAPTAAVARNTLVAAVAPPHTGTALGSVEIAAGRAADPDTASRLAGFAAALAGGEGTRLGAGEIAVLELPDAARDGDAVRRPRLTVREGRARVVSLGPAGGVTADVILSAGGGEEKASLVVPPATRGLVVVGLEATAASEVPVAGWCAAVPLPSATDGVLVGAGCVVDAAGRVPGRGVAALRAGWVLPGELVGGESAVTTTFAAPVAAVAVAMEGGIPDDVALGVEGAERPAGPDGRPEAPLLVIDGASAVLVFRLVRSRPGTALTVTTGTARRLTGVAAVSPAGAGDPALELAGQVARVGLPVLLSSVAEPGLGGPLLVWKEP